MAINKRYYWLKLREDFFQDEAISWLEEQENGKLYSLFYLKLCLKSINNNGVLIRQIGDMLIPYDAKKLAEITNTPKDTVIVALELLKKIGLVKILDNGELYLNQVQYMIGSETESTRRSRKSREKKKQQLPDKSRQNVPLLQCNKNSNKNATTDIEKEIDIEKDKRVVENNSTTTTESENTFFEIHKLYAGEISRNGLCCSPLETEKIKNLLAEYGAEKMRKAIEIAVMRNKRSLGYIEGVLKKEAAPSKAKNELSDEYDIDF